MPRTVEQKPAEAATTPAPASTGRATVPALEARLGQAIPVLDHGFVRVVDYMGDDAAIVQAARVSYGAGTKTVARRRRPHPLPDAPLALDALRDVRAQAPREAAGLRRPPVDPPPHRQRQRILRPLLDPRPRVLHPRPRAPRRPVHRRTTRAAARLLSGDEAARVLALLRDDANRAYDHYEAMLSQDGQQGLARELARMNLPANIYTQWYWKVDLHNLFHFLRLRADAHAQYEIRAYAEALCDVVKDWVPAGLGGLRGLPPQRRHLLGQGHGGAAPHAEGRDGDARGRRDERGGVAGV